MKNTRFIVESAVIAALYTALTLAFQPLSYGAEGLIQVRISEALTILPYFTPAAVPGLFIGCVIANLFSPVGVIDVVVGSLATLIAAYLSYRVPNRLMVPMPPVVVNGLIIGAMLHYVYNVPLLLSILAVTAGQLAACYILGFPLLLVLERYRNQIFRR